MSKGKGGKGAGKDENRKGSQLMNQMGFDISQIGGGGAMSMDDDTEYDSDLEAELLALQDGHPRSRSKSPRPKPEKKPETDISNIENMAAACMQDLDENVSDEDDPDLLAELQDIADDNEVPVSMPEKPTQSLSPIKPQNTATDTVSLLQERISNYKLALSNAKASNETSKARRYDRSLKTLETLLKSSKAGKAVPEDEIPPPVATGMVREEVKQDIPQHISPPQQSQLPVSTPEPTEVKQPVVDKEKEERLKSRQMEFKQAAFHAKNSGDKTKALEYMKIVKQFDHVIASLESGQEVDLSQMPELPSNNTQQSTVPTNATVVKVDVEIPKKKKVPTATLR